MPNALDYFVKQLQDNDVEHEVVEGVVFTEDEEVMLIDVPFGENKRGLFLTLSFYFHDGEFKHVDLETD